MRVRREARLLLDSSLSSLLLAMELFNRPYEGGRQEAVLLHLGHALELLLKAVIVQRGGRIREPRSANTIGFAKCLGKCLDDVKTKVLSRAEALPLQAIHALRDEAQHYLISVSEQTLYAMSRSAIAMYATLLERGFNQKLADVVPTRVLPLSADPPRDLDLIVDDEVRFLRRLIKRGVRRGADAKSRVRALEVIERAITDAAEKKPSERDLDNRLHRLRKGEAWTKVFPGLAGLSLNTEGEGATLTLRITKKEGTPVHVVGEGADSYAVVAVKTVDTTGYYNLSFTLLAEQLQDVLTRNRLSAVIWHLKIKDNPKYSRVFRFGKSAHQQYSQNVPAYIREQLTSLNVPEVWEAFRRR